MHFNAASMKKPDDLTITRKTTIWTIPARQPRDSRKRYKKADLSPTISPTCKVEGPHLGEPRAARYEKPDYAEA
jgi:hypothetical protein